jgi:hypothetical protein
MSQELDERGVPINDPNAPVLDAIERPLPGSTPAQPPLEEFGAVPQLSSTGMQMDLSFLDREFDDSLTDLQKEIYYQAHVEKLLPSRESAGIYARERMNQQLARKDPIYQQKLKRMEAEAITAWKTARGEQLTNEGLEYYTDPETNQLAARVIPGSPADQQAQGSTRQAAQISANLLRDLDNAEALMTAWSTGGTGRLMKMIPIVGGGTGAGRLDAMYGRIKDSISYGGLLELKKSGVGLGSVQVKELEMLGNLMGVLDVGMPVEFQRQTINSVRSTFSDIMSKATPEDLQKFEQLRAGTSAPKADAKPTEEVEDFGGVMMRRYSDGTWKKE